MNKERIALCITMMQDIITEHRAFNMHVWQQRKSSEGAFQTLEELHTCGSAACFGGYLALQPWFHEAGGKIGWMMAPSFKGVDQYDAIAKYLEVSAGIAEALTGCDQGTWYGKNLQDVTALDVLEQLKTLLEHGELRKEVVLK